MIEYDYDWYQHLALALCIAMIDTSMAIGICNACRFRCTFRYACALLPSSEVSPQPTPPTPIPTFQEGFDWSQAWNLCVCVWGGGGILYISI